MQAARARPSFFDQWSSTYDDRSLQRFAYRPVHDAVLDRVRGLHPETVLDCGCGTGQLTQRLIGALPDALVVGVDLSGGMLDRAARRLGSDRRSPASLVQASAQNLPLAPSSLDLVVCTESFHWYPDQAGVLDHLADLIRPGGRIVIASIATVTDGGDLLLRAATRRGNQIRAIPPRRMRRLLDGAGFDVLHQRRIPRLSPIGWPVITDAERR